MNNHQNFSTVGEEGYLHLLEHILLNGYSSSKERTGTGTLVSPTPHQLHFPDVDDQFPLFTTKYVSFNMLACEMLWFISGSTNTKDLRSIGSLSIEHMWNKWADNHGELGPVYGKQWREWEGITVKTSTDGVPLGFRPEVIDQLQNVIDSIKENPEGRRHIVSAWNPADLDDMALPPCHLMYQFTCEPLSKKEKLDKIDSKSLDPFEEAQAVKDAVQEEQYKLHLHLTQRSCDMFLGVPFNIAQYALLLQLVAQVTNTVPGGFTWTGVNCHIYKNHIKAVEKQLSRERYNPPRVELDTLTKDNGEFPSIDSFMRENITLKGYNHHPKIKAEVSV